VASGQGGVVGSAQGQDEGFVKKLQRANGRGDRGKQDDRFHRGDRDLEKLLQGRGAVDIGGFVEDAGDCLQAGNHDHHVVASPAPGDGHDD